MKTLILTKVLFALFVVSVVLAVTTALEATPAKFLTPLAANTCFSGGSICTDGEGGWWTTCKSAIPSNCNSGNCGSDTWTDITVNPNRVYHYCMCTEDVNPEDPRSHGDWDCGIAGVWDISGNPINAICYNSNDCVGFEVCARTFSYATDCYSCSCEIF